MQTFGKGITGLTSGTGGPDGNLYTSQAQTGLGNNCYGSIRGGNPETDSDHDGMPDDFEIAMGTNPTSDDAMKMMPDGYAAIEHYLNWLGDYHAKTASGSSVVIDLAQYASGFSDASPVFAVTDSMGGTVTLMADGHQVRFAPAAGFSGMAVFKFSITGKDQSFFAEKLSVLVVPGTTGFTA